MYCCPKCRTILQKKDRSYVCENGHVYDLAKEGYVNLLLANMKRSKDPGDPKDSLQSRKAFLSKGYYQPLSDQLNVWIAKNLPKGGSFLDAGCGTGYYLQRAMETRPDGCYDAVDIGKEAVRICAKLNPNANCAVASVFHLPVADGAYDMAMSVFCPYSKEEFARIIKPGGVLLAVMPGKKHLFELKEVVYDNPYENEEAGYKLDDEFVLEESCKVTDFIHLSGNDDIRALWNMTPYVHKTSPKDTEKLFAREQLDTTIDFLVMKYRRKG
ncbi:MAG: methyltransferase domain-containing protein [Erysipelotrichaceae bacterium]|nr:methyltransferase domain-containing protein [Erysipelotrichaceae bacterium]